MAVLVMTLFWLAQGLYAVALITGLMTAADGRAKGPVRALLACGVIANLSMFAVMFAASKFPVDYEFMNSLYKSFFTAVILVFGMKKHESALPTIFGLCVVLFFPLTRVYMSANLGLQDQMAYAFSIFAVFFGVAGAVATAFFGYCFCLSVSWFVSPENGAPGGVKTSGMIFKTALWGFIVFTFAQLFGSIWAQTAGWGDVWVWGSSHLFSAVLWIFYAGMLHAPSAPRLSEKVMPAMGVAGFSIIFFWTFYSQFVVLPAYNLLRAALMIYMAGGVA
jgi:hypothetical protein